ncbi:LVIVD repeat-containing protein [Mucilaginibacter myungsuensis]|uniref:LVIVD repeat-containing protein n=1 Tax=Mucilaginibacter myungsuensis TaxID=649104 RepID=A0A929KVA7_9SPHI|nr:hypothetical protein [Mucilaginibacter myungsuensis]MBE9662246.1 hypothetical protein [Mucilaginibacter myungsuensis]MDN3599318.1 hypothetical protein [Mucilaginibacter myungsuensis]
MNDLKKTLSLAVLILLFTACGKDYVGPNNTGTNAGIGGSLARFAVAGNTLYTVTPNRLNTYDITNAALPVYRATSYLNANSESIFATPKFLYIGAQTGMSIFDAADPFNPKYLGGYSHARACDPVVANDKYAFASLRSSSVCTIGQNQIDVIDITVPTAPKFLLSYPMTEPYGLGLDGNYLFVCDRGLKLYDITDVAKPVLKQTINIGARDVILQSGKLICIATDGLYQFNYAGGTLVQISKLNLN